MVKKYIVKKQLKLFEVEEKLMGDYNVKIDKTFNEMGEPLLWEAEGFCLKCNRYFVKYKPDHQCFREYK